MCGSEEAAQCCVLCGGEIVRLSAVDGKWQVVGLFCLQYFQMKKMEDEYVHLLLSFVHH